MSVVPGAIAHYHELLATKHLASTSKGLAATIRQRNLTFLGRPLCRVLRPYLTTADRLDAVSRAATIVVRGLNTLARELLSNPDLRREIPLSADEEMMCRHDSIDAMGVIGRLDGFVSGDEVKFIEFNARPSTVVEDAQMPGAFASLPIMEEFSAAYDVAVRSVEDAFVDAVVAVRDHFEARGQPTLTVIGGLADLANKEIRDTANSLGPVFRRVGWNASMVSAKALEHRGNRVFCKGQDVGAMYVVNWDRLQGQLPFSHPFWTAVRDGTICILNSKACASLRGNKALFAMLSDPLYATLYETETANGLADHVPWTRQVRTGKTRWQGESVDLVSFIRRHRERFVLKPAASYGGQGVVAGWICNDATWASAIDLALSTPYVVQERVHEHREPFPTMSRNRLDIREYLTDLNMFVWGLGRVGGFMARVSPGPLMNLSAGHGTTAPVFTVQPR